MTRYHYISDIHIDENAPSYCTSLDDLSGEMALRAEELTEQFGDYSHGETLLIAGDIGNSVAVVSRFIAILHGYWHGRIIMTLGNHELWNFNANGKQESNQPSCEDIIARYKDKCGMFATVLENELLVSSEEYGRYVLSHDAIMEAQAEKLRELLSKANMAVLGGIGYAGYNHGFNADSGMYTSNLSVDEEIERTQLWRDVYDKLLECCDDLPLVVLTHMPHTDWGVTEINPNWRYVTGHTHSNRREKIDDQVVVYSDNQIGSGWGSWKIKTFVI